MILKKTFFLGICDDEEACFQIWLKDKNKKPQGKHLQARCEFLLKYLARHARAKELKAKKTQHSPKKPLGSPPMVRSCV